MSVIVGMIVLMVLGSENIIDQADFGLAIVLYSFLALMMCSGSFLICQRGYKIAHGSSKDPANHIHVSENENCYRTFAFIGQDNKTIEQFEEEIRTLGERSPDISKILLRTDK
jgi:hypothetical protein